MGLKPKFPLIYQTPLPFNLPLPPPSNYSPGGIASNVIQAPPSPPQEQDFNVILGPAAANPTKPPGG